MIFWGITPSGKRLLLGEPAEASIAYDQDAPADLLRARFPAESMWEELAEVEAWENGEPVFRGIVDEQNTRLDPAGLTVELVSRSLEGLLLDNEAEPGVIASPSLDILEKRLLTPLGLSLGEGSRAVKRGVLTVDKGDSCWTVLERFCQSFLGAEPWVDLEGRVQCGGKVTALELAEILSAQVSLLPCRRISEVWLQSCRGGYDTRYRSKEKGTRRRRYLSAAQGSDPRDILAQGERESFSLTLSCAGPWRPMRRARASVTLPGIGRFENCRITGALYRRDKTGERTRLTLEREEKREGLCG